MTESSTLDRLATKFESTASHYIAHRDQLYRLLSTCALLTYIVSIIWSISAAIPYYDIYFDVPRIGIWFIVKIVAHIMLMGLTLGMRSRIGAQRSTGLTLAATFLIANLLTLHILILIFGIFAFANEPFRTSAREWGPQWYRDLCAQLD